MPEVVEGNLIVVEVDVAKEGAQDLHIHVQSVDEIQVGVPVFGI